jgi:hypothetical protein
MPFASFAAAFHIYSQWCVIYLRTHQNAQTPIFVSISGILFEIMPRRQETVKVAAVQAAPVSFDLPKSLAKVAHFTAEAAKAGADLVVFP